MFEDLSASINVTEDEYQAIKDNIRKLMWTSEGKMRIRIKIEVLSLK